MGVTHLFVKLMYLPHLTTTSEVVGGTPGEDFDQSKCIAPEWAVLIPKTTFCFYTHRFFTLRSGGGIFLLTLSICLLLLYINGIHWLTQNKT